MHPTALDRRVAKLALLAQLLFCLSESLSYIVTDNLELSAVYILPFVYGLFCFRKPPAFENSGVALTLILLVWFSVIYSTYSAYPASSGTPLLLIITFVFLTGQRALVLSLAGLAMLAVLAVENEAVLVQQLVALKSIVFWALITVFIFFFSKRLLQVKREALNNSRVDPVTGAGNRVAMVEELSDAAEVYRRYRVETTAISIRVPDMSELIVNLGESGADQILLELVNIWNSRIRNTDRLFRYGDDSFILLLVGTTRPSSEVLTTDLERACGVYDFSHGGDVDIRINVATVKDYATWEEWLASLIRNGA